MYYSQIHKIPLKNPSRLDRYTFMIDAPEDGGQKELLFPA